MSTDSKNNASDPEKSRGAFIKKSSKLLTIAAVILFLLLISRTNNSNLQPSEENSWFSSIKPEELITETQNSADILGGSILSLEESLMNNSLAAAADASVDFTSDDEAENMDLSLIQENSILAPTSPSPGSIFRDFVKEPITYIVQSGDNPEKIALSFGINTNTLLWANNLKDGDLIHPGDTLVILPINGVRIKVAANDSMEALAKKYQGKSEEIIAFNSLPADGSLRAGDFLIIPGGEMPTPPKPKITAPRYSYSLPKADWLIIPTTGYNWGRLHGFNAVDIANQCGTPIYAAAAGKVILSDATGWNGGYGKYIKIQHSNGVVTLYAHASHLFVDSGENVGRGQLIAYVGTTGRSTGCHLHFEVRGAKHPLAR